MTNIEIAKKLKFLYDSGEYDPEVEDSILATIDYLSLDVTERGGCIGHYADENYYAEVDEDGTTEVEVG